MNRPLVESSLSQLAEAIRSLVVHRPDCLIYYPTKPIWGLLLQRSGQYAILNVPGAARIAELLEPGLGGGKSTVEAGRLVRALAATGLDLLDPTGQEIHSVTLRGVQHTTCCYLATDTLPWIDHESSVMRTPTIDTISVGGLRVDSSIFPSWWSGTEAFLGTAVRGPSTDSAEAFLSSYQAWISNRIRGQIPVHEAIAAAIEAEIGRKHLLNETLPAWLQAPHKDLLDQLAQQWTGPGNPEHSPIIGIDDD